MYLHVKSWAVYSACDPFARKLASPQSFSVDFFDFKSENQMNLDEMNDVEYCFYCFLVVFSILCFCSFFRKKEIC